MSHRGLRTSKARKEALWSEEPKPRPLGSSTPIPPRRRGYESIHDTNKPSCSTSKRSLSPTSTQPFAKVGFFFLGRQLSTEPIIGTTNPLHVLVLPIPATATSPSCAVSTATARTSASTVPTIELVFANGLRGTASFTFFSCSIKTVSEVRFSKGAKSVCVSNTDTLLNFTTTRGRLTDLTTDPADAGQSSNASPTLSAAGFTFFLGCIHTVVEALESNPNPIRSMITTTPLTGTTLVVIFAGAHTTSLGTH